MNSIRPDYHVSVNGQHHWNEMTDAAEQHRLACESTEGQITRLGRLSARLRAIRANITHNIQAAADNTSSQPLPHHTSLLGGKQTFEV